MKISSETLIGKNQPVVLDHNYFEYKKTTNSNIFSFPAYEVSNAMKVFPNMFILNINKVVDWHPDK